MIRLFSQSDETKLKDRLNITNASLEELNSHRQNLTTMVADCPERQTWMGELVGFLLFSMHSPHADCFGESCCFFAIAPCSISHVAVRHCHGS